MALNAAGYTAAGAGTTAANGNYVPVTGAYATAGGATQYTNGTDFLSFNGSSTWGLFTVAGAGGVPLYTAAGSTTTFPLSGWTAATGGLPAPTFNGIGPTPAASFPRNRTTVVVY